MSNLIVARGQSPSGNGDPGDDLNHLYNGRFASALLGIDGWQTTSSDAAIDHVVSDPVFGTGSLHCTVTADTGGSGAYQSVHIQNELLHWGQTWRLTFDYRGDDIALMVFMDYTGASDLEALYITGTAVAQSASVDIVIPSGTSGVLVGIQTDWNGAPQDGKDYWLGSVMLKTIAFAP